MYDLLVTMTTAFEQSPNLAVELLSNEGSSLVAALRDVLDALPGGAAGTREFSRTLGIDKSLASRVLSSVRASDPLSSLALMPGPAPLRELLRAARKKGVPAPVITRAELAIESYERTLRHQFEHRAGLDAVLSAALPEARKRYEITARQAVFRGTAAIKGISAEVSTVTFILHPGNMIQTGRTEGVMIGGYIGLRRVRPQARMQFTVFPKPDFLPPPASATQTSEPTPTPATSHDLHGVLLREFCSPTDLPIHCQVLDNAYKFEVLGTEVGIASSVNLFLAERYPRHLNPAPLATGATWRRVGATIEIPTRRLILDTLIHKSLWQDARLELRAYDTVFRGRASPPDPSRDVDLLPLVESIDDVQGGIADLRSSRLPRYVELIQHACDRMGWNPLEFRAHRCEMQYPMYGAQVIMLIHAP